MEKLSPHPRLLVTDEDLVTIKAGTHSDAFARVAFDDVLAYSELLLAKPTNRYVKVDGQMINEARDVQRRIVTLAGLYRLTRDKRFANRAIDEMLAVAAFPDWNPSHLLDVGEFSAGMGIGYDWLYDVMSASDRVAIRNGIEQNGVQAFLSFLTSTHTVFSNNWGDVTYGGVVVGALAIAERDESPSSADARAVLGYAKPAMEQRMKDYAPDGARLEGPNYWNFASKYDVLYLASLETALGSDFGQSDAAGLRMSGYYRIASMDPQLNWVTFSDTGLAPEIGSQMFWLSRRYEQPIYARKEEEFVMPGSKGIRAGLATDFLTLAWSILAPKSSESDLPLIMPFWGANQVFMRTSWNDSNAWYLAMKGGKPDVSHGHADAGSFILNGLGQRWGIDLGPESYAAHDYFSPRRWEYYRAKTESHNTLTIGGKNEKLSATARLKLVHSEGGSLTAIMDLSEMYSDTLKSWNRGIRMRQDSVLVRDEISTALLADSDIEWHFMTTAKVNITADGRRAQLSQNGRSIWMDLQLPSDCRFVTRIPIPHLTTNPLNGVTEILVSIPHPSYSTAIEVLFVKSGSKHEPTGLALSEWH